MNDAHVLPHDNHDGEDHLVRDKVTAHKDHKKHILPNDAGVDTTNVGAKDGKITRISD